ncbi:MAG: hypothetical protein KGJ23_07425 [Euryarchaeota archaeon]|nr:hypothetical protein [Euryarchaeota archaeon]MDE1836429.1 hypothetical protein [Euryarchaeota archaeon]MDE2044177.1 hypothetical protein [Thermoplasmata archaeon]
MMETVRPIEIPVIAQVKRRLAEGQFAEAVTLAYHTAVLDLQRAYRTQFPAHWTHLDVVQWTRRNNLGIVADCISKLYQSYEPVRYGRASDVQRADIVSPLTSLYAQSPLWRLYAPSSVAGYGYGNGYGNGGGGAYANALGYSGYGRYGEERSLPPPP